MIRSFTVTTSVGLLTALLLLGVAGAQESGAQQPGPREPSPEVRDQIIYGPKQSPQRRRREECVQQYETRRYKKAAECWREVVDGGAGDIFAIRTLAFSLYYANDFETARYYFDHALERNPNDLFSLKGRGLLALTVAKPAEAEGLFARAARLKPRNEQWRRLYGVSLQRQGRFEEALVAFGDAVKLNPKSISALSLKGAALFSLERFSEAQLTFDRILELDPTSEVAWRNKGSCLIRGGKPEEAIGMFDVALKINPLSVEAWYNRGVALERMGDVDEARRHYERALRIDSGHHEARRALDLLDRTQEGNG